jgi:hypothetical protein
MLTDEMRERKELLLERRRRREPFCGPHGASGHHWLVEFYSGSKSYFYMDEMPKYRGVLEFTQCQNASLTVPLKLNHLNATHLSQCTIRTKGSVSGIELTRVTDSRIFITGSTPIIQVDLCSSIDLYFSMELAAEVKIVHASNHDIRVIVDGICTNLNSSIFSADQQVSFFHKGQWQSVLSQTIKEHGYLDLSVVEKIKSK